MASDVNVRFQASEDIDTEALAESLHALADAIAEGRVGDLSVETNLGAEVGTVFRCRLCIDYAPPHDPDLPVRVECRSESDE